MLNYYCVHVIMKSLLSVYNALHSMDLTRICLRPAFGCGPTFQLIAKCSTGVQSSIQTVRLRAVDSTVHVDSTVQNKTAEPLVCRQYLYI